MNVTYTYQPTVEGYTLITYSINPAWFDRGFTGHEMLREFNLINMNARIYDPIIARMLQPDNYVQDGTFTQNYNRYSYVLNNPTAFTDPSGDLIGTFFTAIWDFGATIFVHGGLDPTNTGKNRREAWANFDPTGKWSKTNKAWRIDKGLFKTDPNRTFMGNAIMLFSRFTWEIYQTTLGNMLSHVRNISGNVDNVDYYGGATLVNDKDGPGGEWGMTLGSYINSNRMMAVPYKDEMFRHEYGHTIQSRITGFYYLQFVAAPSLIGSILNYEMGINNHNDEWYETHANRLALRYFNNHVPNSLNLNKGGRPWDYHEYPTTYKFNWYTIPSILMGFML